MERLLDRLRSVGPSALVTAAFIGPGTVTTCTRAGAGFGHALLWVVVLSTAAALVLQEMAARLGAMTGKDLAAHLHDRARGPLRWVVVGLVLGAVGFGCAAYEIGNLSGGAIGLRVVFDTSESRAVLVSGLAAGYLLLRGGYRFLERVLTLAVATMGAAFVVTALAAGPALSEWLGGVFVPNLPPGASVLALALLGTTVVPYNLFLHSHAVTRRGEPGEERLAEARFDLLLCLPLGGLVSGAIVVTSATVLATEDAVVVAGPEELAMGLRTMLGPVASLSFGVGLFAAGLTSAITAPVAASFAVCGVLGRRDAVDGPLGKAVALGVLAVGLGVSLAGFDAADLIVAAQALNGVLLPVSAVFLLWVVNDASVLGDRRNRLVANALGAAVVLLALVLGLRNLGLGP